MFRLYQRENIFFLYTYIYIYIPSYQIFIIVVLEENMLNEMSTVAIWRSHIERHSC